MGSKNVLGFDPSLVSSGYAYHDEELGQVSRGLIKPGKRRSTERLKFILDEFESVCISASNPLIFYEGYSMGSRSGRAFDIGELGGVLKMFAYTHGLTLVLVPPTVLKKFITGKGNSSKEEVVLQLYKRFGYEESQNDKADAIGLYLFGEHFVNQTPAVKALIPKCEVLSPPFSYRRKRRIQRISS